MRRDLTIIAVAIIMILAMGSLPCPLSAQEKYTDFRGQAVTTDDLGQALFPANPPQAAEPVATRGVTPRERPSPPSPTKAAVALNLFFEFNSAEVQDSADLDKLAQVLKQPQYKNYQVQIEGHTDNIGGRAYNQRLSEKRAESVKNYLVQRFAIAPERLVAKGYGQDQPRVTNNSREGRDQNRRVEVVNLGK